MTAYITVQLVLKDADVFADYRSQASAALAKHGGKILAGGPGSEVLEDTGAGPATAVMAAFPDAEAARAWINDPDLADVHALRKRGAQTMITLLGDL
ncbi:DUF1330 domain-containing protein [Jannaschia sp. M317]|uniref:DUF1330 domain-containing protein n=1 Tax=Jannaschia sp. M317 TaxID=2867011 RepID=UPI0021A90AD6|nr:DUF1330 domain-containing protein [Jannaschia sp. M317]UWQ16369.1 DUF1330 domain-containing protein [Jannaschia sp. M317]